MDDIESYVKNLTIAELQHMVLVNLKRKESVRKYFASDKGKKKRSELNKKYYEKRKAMKELCECS
tara:strand:+ start:540 stop:734 length:195 start_codon:yes stop_codon:yes gene_type:complete